MLADPRTGAELGRAGLPGIMHPDRAAPLQVIGWPVKRTPPDQSARPCTPRHGATAPHRSIQVSVWLWLVILSPTLEMPHWILAAVGWLTVSQGRDLDLLIESTSESSFQCSPEHYTT